MLDGSDWTAKALTTHLGVMRQTTEGTPEGDHVTPIYWAAELRRGKPAPASGQQLHCQFHDGIDNVTVVVLQGPHSLCPGHIGLGHHQFNVTRF